MTQLEKNIYNYPLGNNNKINNNKIFFSIITPIFNSEKYLLQFLDSLVNQEFTNFEIILVNDGSEDNSENIINSYKSKFINIHVINQDNLGQGIARNVGLDYAKGEYILFIDSDDTLSSSKSLLDLYNHIIKNSSSDIIMFGYKKLYGKTIVKPNYKQNKILNMLSVTSLEEKKSLLSIKRIGIPWNKVYKTHFLRNNNIKFADYLKFEDAYFFWQAIILANKITFFDYIFYIYRKHNSSTMRTHDEGNLDIIKIYQLIIKFLQKHHLFSKFEDCLLNRALPSFISQFKKIPFRSKKDFFSNLKAFQLKYNMYEYKIFNLNTKSTKILKYLQTNNFIWFYLKSFLL